MATPSRTDEHDDDLVGASIVDSGGKEVGKVSLKATMDLTSAPLPEDSLLPNTGR